MNSKLLLTGLSLVLGGRIFAQTGPETDSKKIIEKGVDLHDAEKYDEAIKEFQKVHRNDTNYVLACTELMNSYIASGKDSLAVIVADKAKDITSEYNPSIILYKANALDDMNKEEAAVATYMEGMKKYPHNQTFPYELGVLKLKLEKYGEAEQLFEQTIKMNPYYAPAHYQMGNIAVKQGKLIPAMLAWQFYLLIDNSSARARRLVTSMDEMARGEYDWKDVKTIKEFEGMDDFSDLDALVKSKAALGPKYKSKTKLTFGLSKQLQLILEQLQVNKDDKGFSNRFYVPIAIALQKKNYFEPLIYSILSGMGVADVDAWVKKNKADIDEYSSWLLNYINENYTTYDDDMNGKIVNVRHWYRNAKLSATGTKNAAGVEQGYWNYYYPNGILKSEGSFDDKGLRTGLWKFYQGTGIIDETEMYVAGKVTGPIEVFYENGVLKATKNYVENKLDGKQIYYYPTGLEESESVYKAGVEEGMQKSFYANGQLKYEVSVVNAKYEGPLVQYYDNGHIMEKSTFKASSRDGLTQNFYRWPENALQSEYTFVNGSRVGEYKSYHENGSPQETGTYSKTGDKDGVWKEFYDNKTLKSEETYSNGKQNGPSKYYDENGKITEEFLYKNDFLQEYKAYAPDGSIVFQNKKEGKADYDVLLYYPNGNKRKEGKVAKGLLDGTWKQYNRNGYLSSSIEYVAGKKQGKSTDYYENGKVESEVDYVNGQTSGYYRKYYKNGRLMKEGAYIDDKRVGVWYTYYFNGNRESELYYNDGDETGISLYYAINGRPDFEESHELGILKGRVSYDSVGKVIDDTKFVKGSGKLTLLYPDGKKRSEDVYTNDLIEGPYQSWYPGGQQYAVRNYVHGFINGESKFYYPDGKLNFLTIYSEGDRNGKQTEYDEDGSVKKETDYTRGDLNGKIIYYYPNKQVSRSYDYRNNDINGNSSIFLETGELVIERHYVDNFMVSYSYMGKDGQMVTPVPVKNETGEIKSFYKNGNVALVYTLENGAIRGKRIMYYPDGKIASESNYDWNEQTGPAKEYYASGKLKSEENFANDELDGKCIYYYENGKVKSEKTYMNGQEHGVSKHYDMTGKLIATYYCYNDDIIAQK